MRLSVDYTRSRFWPEALWTGSSTLPRLHQTDLNALCRFAQGIVMWATTASQCSVRATYRRV